MRAEEIVRERAARKLTTRMRVRHPELGMQEVAAYSKIQAEAMACNIWHVLWADVADQLRTSVLMPGKVEVA